LSGRIAGTDEMHVKSMRGARLAARRPVVDAFADQPLESLDGQPAPGDATGQNDGPRLDRFPAVEKDLASCRIEPRHGAGHDDLAAETPRLAQRAARELIARYATGEAQIVLDARGGSRLPTGCLALDHERPQSFRCAVHRGGEAGGAAADDH